MASTARGTLPALQRTSELKAVFGTVLSYGPAGAGKTHSIQTLKTLGLNPVVLVTELGATVGLLTLQAEDIPFIKISSHAEMMEVLQALKRKPGKVEYEGTEFGAVVIDSLTHWGEMPLDAYTAIKGWTDLQTPHERKDPRQAYAYLAEKGRQLYKSAFELHGHLYCIAREGLYGDGSPESPFFNAPDLPGQKLAREVPGWPDATVRMRVIAGQHRMITVGEGGSPARVRLPSSVPPLPGRCLPNVAALIKLMCGDLSMLDLLVPAKSAVEANREKETAMKEEKAKRDEVEKARRAALRPPAHLAVKP